MPIVFAGIDTGGTFTDLVAWEPGPSGAVLESWVHKIPSTPSDPGRAVLQALQWLRKRCSPGAEIRIVHGTTVATNALLERKGADVLWITNEGFGDLLALGRQARSELYSLSPAESAFAMDAVLEVPCRLDADGHVLKELDAGHVGPQLDALDLTAFDTAAVCFLYSFLNPKHELAVKQLLAARGLPCSCSHEVLPEPREYERGITTYANAYVMPVIDKHLSEIEAELPPGDSLFVMQSNGGVADPAVLRREAIKTALSGPAGGVAGLAALAAASGLDRLVAFDMGGTSTDVAVFDGEPCMRDEIAVGDFLVRQRMIDIHTIGAGGGSIATVDAGGVLQVGPDSAGADPGPASYGLNGPCTVTDANLLLGRLPADAFKIHGRPLDVAASSKRIRALAQSLDLAPLALAEGIVRVAESAMEKAIRTMTIERGIDPRGFALVPYGGGGGLHAVSLAQAIGMTHVLMPPAAGVFSAAGMLRAPLRVDRVKGYLRNHLAYDLLCRDAEEIAADIRADLSLGDMDGLDIQTRLEVRYAGQSECLEVPLSADWCTIFAREHRRRYGFHLAAAAEVSRLMVSVVKGTHVADPKAEAVAHHAEKLEHTDVYANGDWLRSVPQYSRDGLLTDMVIQGPALIREYSTCTWLPSGAACRVLSDGSLLLETGV